MSGAIGVIGGSGLYEIDGFEEVESAVVKTPFGDPSDVIVGGRLHGREVYFLPRHGRGHRIAPHEINHRANIWAMRFLGVRWIVAVTAVGSLQEKYRPRDIVLPDQFFDRMSRREHHTFFGDGIVAHVSLAEPLSTNLRAILARVCGGSGRPFHDGGTYVSMDGPAFSTRAESNAYRALGFDVIGMTNLPEAKLAREAEIALATVAMITDYDCWRVDEAPVTAGAIGEHLRANVVTAKDILARVIPEIPETADWPEHRALDGAILTPPDVWPAKTKEKLRVILDRFVP